MSFQSIKTATFFPKIIVKDKTELAKTAVSGGVAISTASLVETQIDERTSLDPNSTAVQVGSGAVGMYVAMKVKPLTDRAVDGVVSGGRFVASKTILRKKNKVETETPLTTEPVTPPQQ